MMICKNTNHGSLIQRVTHDRELQRNFSYIIVIYSFYLIARRLLQATGWKHYIPLKSWYRAKMQNTTIYTGFPVLFCISYYSFGSISYLSIQISLLDMIILYR